ncbi:hypothetical protein LUZ60_010143 [Juncus effusus]|nr:hypothetical protein LUZ60_010143 [Juncus effusus]
MERKSPINIVNPTNEAISRPRFAPSSNNLLISSWETGLRLYDVEESVLRSEILTEEALLDCCFVKEEIALTAGSDGCIKRFDLSTGSQDIVGICDDSAISVEYSSETNLVVSCTMDNKINFWDLRTGNSNPANSTAVESNTNSISLSGTNLLAAISNSVFMYDLRNLISPIGAEISSMNYSIKCIRSFPNSRGFVMGSIDGCVGLKYFDPVMENTMGCRFRCHPNSIEGDSHIVSINQIAIHPRR